MTASPPDVGRSPNDGPSEGGFPIVAIGASAGGLEAMSRLLDALPPKPGMAFILVQHLDPTHKSMMVDLLAGHTSMAVGQATHGAIVEPDHLYVIPPGTYLSLAGGALQLSSPQARHGARLPFDFLLLSLAKDAGPRAIAVVLSGAGGDGSQGVKAIKDRGGLVIAQDPDQAGYQGMPRSAIQTGVVNLVLPIEEIPAALRGQGDQLNDMDLDPDGLARIIALLQTRTGYDFTLYKEGTLRRRVERRMAMASIDPADMDGYLTLLDRNPEEFDLLSKDLLINVTGFFRDPEVFEMLATRVIPDLVRDHPADRPLRIWIAGCSSGEEAYSLAILFREAIVAAQRNIKLLVFASDIDADAVALARDGLYSPEIAAHISPARLARFFAREERGYRVLPELRSLVVFTVQDVLTDPPFSRIDFISCRNLLIYLLPAAQAKALTLFHFALRSGGMLLLGKSETIGANLDDRFQVISKTDRLYRHIGRARPGDFGFTIGSIGGVRVPLRQNRDRAPARHAALADLCRDLVMEAYAPASVLINRKNECLFSLGPTDRYLRVVPGLPTHDLLVMARDEIRTKLRATIQKAIQTNARVVMSGARADRRREAPSFSIAARPVLSDGEELLLVSFIEEPASAAATDRAGQQGSGAEESESRVAELEHELDLTRAELQGAILSLESYTETQKEINEEALSVNEEHQSVNEELVTSQEELQSLNEELTALNSQLQETLERQRTTANDLQNVLFSTDVATLFLDRELNIRFFTPATRSQFHVRPGDIGRPLAELSALAPDSGLLDDAQTVLRTLEPLQREIEVAGGNWYVRRILPYRTQEDAVDGVVITFVDITERRRDAEALEAAKRHAEAANLAKSRFLAAASHDLRQPLQTLSLLQGILARTATDEKAKALIARFEETLGAMSGMLSALLDINQIEVGAVHPERRDIVVDDLFRPLIDEFGYLAESKGLKFRAVRCGLTINSDPRLLEQMIRNLLSNALKYTRKGRVLIGCRRRGGMASIEIVDSGIGIPDHEIGSIFDEYHQIDNPARERERGLGLGLSVVQRLGGLLGHRIVVRSLEGKGSRFTIEVPLAEARLAEARLAGASVAGAGPPSATSRPPGEPPMAEPSAPGSGLIMVVEDDPDIRDLLQLLLGDEGHSVTAVADGVEALERLAQESIRPDLIVADYNLPRGLNGLRFADHVREQVPYDIPVIILTGDISANALKTLATHNSVQLSKPVKASELTATVRSLLRPPPVPVQPSAPDAAAEATIFLVEDDKEARSAIRQILLEAGWKVEDFGTAEAFLAAFQPDRPGCLLVDAMLPDGMSGMELLGRQRANGQRLPSIMITGKSDVGLAVDAMKAGAVDFIEKPFSREELLASVARAVDQSLDMGALAAARAAAASRLANLSPRQRSIMDLVLAGHPSKNIAADLRISQRTVENHRAAIMKKTGAKSIPALARLALTATAGEVADDSAVAGPPHATPPR